MEGLKRSSCGASWDHVHHGSFDLEEVSLSEERTDEINDLVSDLEDLLDMRVHDHVKISVTVASILGQGVLLDLMLSGEHVQTVRKDLNVGRSD